MSTPLSYLRSIDVVVSLDKNGFLDVRAQNRMSQQAWDEALEFAREFKPEIIQDLYFELELQNLLQGVGAKIEPGPKLVFVPPPGWSKGESGEMGSCYGAGGSLLGSIWKGVDMIRSSMTQINLMKMYSWAEDLITDGSYSINEKPSTEIDHVDPERNNRDQVKNTECHTELHANYPLIDGGLTYIDQKLKEMEISMEKMKVLVQRIQRARAQTRSYVPHSRW